MTITRVPVQAIKKGMRVRLFNRVRGEHFVVRVVSDAKPSTQVIRYWCFEAANGIPYGAAVDETFEVVS